MAHSSRSQFDAPLAYFLTWTTYGTWLPGDERGWVKRQKGLQESRPLRASDASVRMCESAFRLGRQERALVEDTIRAHCDIRGWHIHALACRTNHVHVVVTANLHPDNVLRELKSWCTRKLRAGTESSRQRRWTERGSKRYINTEASLEAAVRYVSEFQERPH